MQNLSKSKLLAFLQCRKRLWLEAHRPDLQEQSATTEVRFKIGHEVGEVAQRIYDPQGLGVSIDVAAEGFDRALARSATLLNSAVPIFQAGFASDGALVFTDIMLPRGRELNRSWHIVEVKSSSSVKEHHHADVAIQAFVAKRAGVPIDSIALAHIDSDWVYPGDEKYQGLLVEDDLTVEALGRGDEVRDWIAKAQEVVRETLEPQIRTGAQCSDPYDCIFRKYCQSQEPQAEYPVEWLPHKTKAINDFVETNSIKDLRYVPNAYLDERQRRVKAQAISGKPFFDRIGAAAELGQHNLPALFLDFETIYFPVPIWKGTRPYQQIPYQFSCHVLSPAAKIEHSEFLDLSGDDPSERFAEALITACREVEPIFVYSAGFEAARIVELADRFPRMRRSLLAIKDRIVDLLPIARKYYYHPSQHGSWSLKNMLPTIATDLSYDRLDGVRDGGAAMAVYLEAIHSQTTCARKDQIRKQLLDYCSLDTYGLVRLWQYFSSQNQVPATFDVHQCKLLSPSLITKEGTSGAIPMAIPQLSARSTEPHVHPLEARCPVCDQPIPN